MTNKKQTSSWVPLVGAVGLGTVLILVLAGTKFCDRDDAPPSPAPDASVVVEVDLPKCLAAGAQCGGDLPTVAAPDKPAPPARHRALRVVQAWASSGGGLRAILQATPLEGVGAASIVLAEFDTQGTPTTLLPPVEHGARAAWRQDALIFTSPSDAPWTVLRYGDAGWAPVGQIEPQRTAEAVASVPGGTVAVYLRQDSSAAVTRFEDGQSQTSDLLPPGLPWLRVHVGEDGGVTAFRSREAEDAKSAPRLEVAHLPPGGALVVTETLILELGFDKVGFSVEACFAGESLWALIAGHILMASHDGGRTWSRVHTFASTEALHGPSLACAGERLTLAGKGADARPWGSVCRRDVGCDGLAMLADVNAQWVSSQDARVLLRPGSTSRVGLVELADADAKIVSVFEARGIDDARKSIGALRVADRWFRF